MIECPSCRRRHEPQLICPECGAPLGAEVDCFKALGVARKLAIDLPALERAYHNLSRKIHPDRFASSPVPVRTASLTSTALLTRSYRTLRDPIARGLYWLELNGEKLAENNKQVPIELAELVFEVQEQLAELRAAAKRGGANGIAREVGSRRGELQASMDAAGGELARNFDRWDTERPDDHDDRKARDDRDVPDGPAKRSLTLELKQTLSKIAYLRTLIRDVDRELESLQAT